MLKRRCGPGCVPGPTSWGGRQYEPVIHPCRGLLQRVGHLQMRITRQSRYIGQPTDAELIQLRAELIFVCGPGFETDVFVQDSYLWLNVVDIATQALMPLESRGWEIAAEIGSLDLPPPTMNPRDWFCPYRQLAAGTYDLDGERDDHSIIQPLGDTEFFPVMQLPPTKIVKIRQPKQGQMRLL